MNSQRGLINLLVGLFARIITLIIGILIPRLVLINLGSEANGLLNSVTTALTYMSLLEAGVGTASLQALYRPCAAGEKNSINAILAATDHFYRRTGIVYSFCVIVLSVIFPIIINTTLPREQVFFVVLLTGFSGVLSYLFQGKFKILLAAEGKNYVTTSILTVFNVCINLSKALLLMAGANVVGVQTSYFLFSIVQTIVYTVYMKRHYPWLNLNVKADYDAISQRNAALVHQVSTMIFSNTDVLILSIFTSLKEVSVYSLYVLIYGLVSSLGEIAYESYRYVLGQAFHGDKERFMRLFNTYEVFVFIISFSLFTVCRALINPFLALYTSGVEDITYVDKYLPWLFALYYIMNNGRTSSNVVISIAERFEDTKWRSVVESIINVTVSLWAVKKLGIYGVLLGTIVALLYRTNDMIIYAARILKRSPLITYKRWIINIICFVVISNFGSVLSDINYTYVSLAGCAIIISSFVASCYLLVNMLTDRQYVLYGFSVAWNSITRIIEKLRK